MALAVKVWKLMVDVWLRAEGVLHFFAPRPRLPLQGAFLSIFPPVQKEVGKELHLMMWQAMSLPILDGK